jgi:hypothetical protein
VVPSQGRYTTSSISSFLLIWIRVLISYHQPRYIAMSDHNTEEHVVQSLFIFSITGIERIKMKAECLLLRLWLAFFVSVNQYATITATEFTGILHRKLTHCWVWRGHQPPSHNSTTSTSTRNWAWRNIFWKCEWNSGRKYMNRLNRFNNIINIYLNSNPSVWPQVDTGLLYKKHL